MTDNPYMSPEGSGERCPFPCCDACREGGCYEEWSGPWSPEEMLATHFHVASSFRSTVDTHARGDNDGD